MLVEANQLGRGALAVGKLEIACLAKTRPEEWVIGPIRSWEQSPRSSLNTSVMKTRITHVNPNSQFPFRKLANVLTTVALGALALSPASARAATSGSFTLVEPMK